MNQSRAKKDRDKEERQDEEEKEKNKHKSPQITGTPGPPGGTQEHTAAHLPEADLRKGASFWFPASTVRAPRPTGQQHGNSAGHQRGGDTDTRQ